VAKMVATLDVMSAGRMELGLGAGWKEEEWLAYGYDFPPIAERTSRLEDALRIARAMFYRPDGATYEGPTARIAGAISYPEPFRPEGIPIVVGGNGRRRTWPLAVRFADELNLDAMPPHEVPEAMDAISRLCTSVGRDPATLRVSVHVWWEQWSQAEPEALIEAYRATGIHRLMTLIREAAWDDGALEAFRDVAVRAGAEIAGGETTNTAEPVASRR
jgi:alkanesulfonate monooxygenase SsuD/methylene tetrahydromethanopterin reductase-like flavin-dependent oxidoreductase (luciferase family)